MHLQILSSVMSSYFTPAMALVKIFCFFCQISIQPSLSGPISPIQPYRIPAEYEPHDLTYMAWPAETALFWSETKENFHHVEKEIAALAEAIAEFEPVVMFVNPPQEEEASHALRHISNLQIVIRPINDVWVRDSLPVFGIETRAETESLIGVDINYHPIWHNYYMVDDARLAKWLLRNLSVPRITAPFRTEGGALEFDGERTLLVTQSSIFNPNRNPGFRTRDELEDAMKSAFQVEKVIWLPGKYNTTDTTDIHVDTLARFIRPGVILLSLPPQSNPYSEVCPHCAAEAEQVLLRERDAAGRKFKIFKIYAPDPRYVQETIGWPPTLGDMPSAYAFTYVNFYILNGAVILPQFGDMNADRNAREVIGSLFPDRVVVPVNLVYLAHGGGTAHCVTKHEPRIGKNFNSFIY